MMVIDLLIYGAAQLVTCYSPDGPKRGPAMGDVGLIHNGAVAVHEGRILAAGDSEGLRERYRGRQNIDAAGKIICPGFVDPHTHVVYAGDRVDEFEQRVRGATYMEIMAAGGGIASTMAATRQSTVAELVAQSRPRLEAMLALGTTTVEIKTGYGLSTNDELKISEDRGASARGCRLDPRMLEELVGSTEVAVERGVDVVIINKFGKQEALGGGFRNVIAKALGDGIPTIVAVNLAYLDSWRSFAAEFADELPPNIVEVRKWLADRLPDEAQSELSELDDGVTDQHCHAGRNYQP